VRLTAGMSDRFTAQMLARNSRIEGDLIDQLFNSSEKRLARTLLLPRLREQERPACASMRDSQVPAEMLATRFAHGLLFEQAQQSRLH
jgi:CRP/FNR family cyclic AMP-dependent transcriptional regulator